MHLPYLRVRLIDGPCVGVYLQRLMSTASICCFVLILFYVFGSTEKHIREGRRVAME